MRQFVSGVFGRHLGVSAAVIFASILFYSAAASADPGSGWYLEGMLTGVELEDADNELEITSATPASTTCFLEIPGILCLIPSTTPGTPGQTVEFETEYDTGIGGGLALGYDFTSPWRVEGELKYLPNDIESAGGVAIDDEVEAIALMANAWYDFNRKGTWQPNIGGGIGAAEISVGSVDDTVAAAQLGGGVAYVLNDRWRITGGYRYFMADDPEFDLNNGELESEYAAHLVQLGVRYNFFDPAPPPDSDGDGVHDGLDECPDTPAGVKVNDKGCPLDSDGDGVPDGIDQCPNTPPGTEVDAKGCAVVKDSDGDGVPDDKDQCPNTPPGQEVLSNGCAVKQSVILQGVNFEFDKAVLTSTAEEILDDVAQTLLDSPGFIVELQGHTDSVGSDSYNQDLSQRRAESVRAYLTGKGVEGDRLRAKGYGESQPIASNDNAEGRATNRRVELKVLDKQ